MLDKKTNVNILTARLLFDVQNKMFTSNLTKLRCVITGNYTNSPLVALQIFVKKNADIFQTLYTACEFSLLANY